MPMYIGWFRFSDPFGDESAIEPRAGVAAVMKRHGNRRWTMLDAVEGENLRETVAGHERRGCWEEHTGGELHWVVFYTPESTAEARRNVVGEIRLQYVMPCSPEADEATFRGCPVLLINEQRERNGH